jgi:hypothetical protein
MPTYQEIINTSYDKYMKYYAEYQKYSNLSKKAVSENRPDIVIVYENKLREIKKILKSLKDVYDSYTEAIKKNPTLANQPAPLSGGKRKVIPLIH